LAPAFKWVRPENLHLTLKFVGETETGKLRLIREALSIVHSRTALELKFGGLGFFPDKKRPRVFWVGIDAPLELPQLAVAVDAALAGLGFPRETRAFVPHLTLARLDGAPLPGTFLAAVEEHGA